MGANRHRCHNARQQRQDSRATMVEGGCARRASVDRQFNAARADENRAIEPIKEADSALLLR